MSSPDLADRPEDQPSRPNERFRNFVEGLKMVLMVVGAILAGIMFLVLVYAILAVVLGGASIFAFGIGFSWGWGLITFTSAALFAAPIAGASAIGSAAAVIVVLKAILGLFAGLAAMMLVLMPVMGPWMAYKYATDTHHFRIKDRPEWVRYEVSRGRHDELIVNITNLHGSRPILHEHVILTCDYHRGPRNIMEGIIVRGVSPGGTVRAEMAGGFGFPGWEHRIDVQSCRVNG